MLQTTEANFSDHHLCIEKFLAAAAAKGLFEKAFEKTFKRIFQTTPDVILVRDEDHNITLANEPAMRLLGGEQRRVVGKKCYQIFGSSSTCRNTGCFVTRVFSTGSPYNTFMNINGRHGEALCFSVNVSPIFGRGDSIRNIIIVLKDVTIQKKIQERVHFRVPPDIEQKSDRFLQTIMNSVGEGVLILNRDYRISDANEGFLRPLGFKKKDVVGRRCYTLIHDSAKACWEIEDDHDCPVKTAFETGTSDSAVHIHRDASGKRLYIEVSAFPLKNANGEVMRVIETHRDITEKRELENRLIQAQKMEAIGTVAGGIAHDFNNILTPIMGHAQLAISKLPESNHLYQHLQQIQDAADRAAGIIQQILAFSKSQMLEKKTLDLNKIIDDFSLMLKRLIREDVVLEIFLEKALWNISADRSRIEQILINLAVNARDAIPNGGTLLIETKNVENADNVCQTCGEKLAGPHVLLMVSDSGVGMDQETQKRIFEPFFTTKEEGKGTGLGLSTVLGITHQHKGHINVYSEPGHGSTFKVYFPKTESVHAEPAVEEAPLEEVGFGSETILFVEDDPYVKNVGKTILSEAGYTVITAENGKEALEIFQKVKKSVDLLITDVIMPKIGGWELAEKIRAIRPDLPILFASGYSMNAAMKDLDKKNGMHFIQKPFSVEVLTTSIRRLLDS